MNTGRTRNSAIELLRCLCMMLIIAHHYSFHGEIPALSAETWCPGRVFLQVIMLYGKTACSVFAILTGYYMSVSRCVGHYRKWSAYYAQVLFYSVACPAVMHFMNGEALGAKMMIRAAVPLVYGSWYARFFLIMYLFVPFINRLVRGLSDRDLTALAALTVLVWSVIPTVFRFRLDFGNLDFFLVMYIVGSWLRRYEKRFREKPAWIYGFAALACAFVIAAPTLILDTLRYEHGLRIAFLENDEGYFATINALPALACAVLLVLCFQRMFFESAAVNVLGRTVFGVYLIHDNDHVRAWLWTVLSSNAGYWRDPWLHAPAKILGVFAVCAAIELLRQKTIGVWFEKLLDAVFRTDADRDIGHDRYKEGGDSNEQSL